MGCSCLPLAGGKVSACLVYQMLITLLPGRFLFRSVAVLTSFTFSKEELVRLWRGLGGPAKPHQLLLLGVLELGKVAARFYWIQWESHRQRERGRRGIALGGGRIEGHGGAGKASSWCGRWWLSARRGRPRLSGSVGAWCCIGALRSWAAVGCLWLVNGIPASISCVRGALNGELRGSRRGLRLWWGRSSAILWGSSSR